MKMFESAIPKILQLFVSSSLLVFPSPSALPKIKKKKLKGKTYCITHNFRLKYYYHH